MPVSMESLTELPEIKSEIKAEDFNNQQSATSVSSDNMSNHSETATTTTTILQPPAPAAITTSTNSTVSQQNNLVDLNPVQQQQQNCNWVGIICPSKLQLATILLRHIDRFLKGKYRL